MTGRGESTERSELEGVDRQLSLTHRETSTTVDVMHELRSIPNPEDPAEALAAVVSLRRLADRLELASVQCAIDQGWTWTQVAQALGVTRQAAHKRHARRVRTGPEGEDGS